MAEVVLVGHVVLDTVVKGNRRWQSLGGTVVYGSFAALRHDAKPVIVSKVGEDFPDEYLLFLARNGIDISYVRVVKGTKTTRFKLTYKDSDRELTLLAKAENIKRVDVDLVDFEGKIALVGSVAGEVEVEALESIRSRATLTAMDLQGYLRSTKIKEPLKLVKSDAALRALSHANIVHADAEEAKVLTGLDPHLSAKWIAERGSGVALVTMGSDGAYVAWKNNLIYVPAAEPSQVIDATGAGDIFLTVFAIEYSRGLSVEEAASIAAAAVSFRVERQGFEGLRERWRVRNRARDIMDKIKPVEVTEAKVI